MSLLRIWREDHTLAWLTALLVVCAWLPLFAGPFLPFPDLPNNTGAASLLWEVYRGHGVAALHYKVHVAPLPYWTAYLIMAALRPLVGALWAAKILCGLVVALLPLGTMRLLAALGRGPRLGLWAFALSWEHNLYAGWVAYMLGMCLAFFALAWLIECESAKGSLAILGMAVLIALTHVEAVAFFLVAGGLVAVVHRQPLRKVFYYAVAASGPFVAVVYPWLKERLKDVSKTVPAAKLFTFDWHTPAVKTAGLFTYSLDDLPSKLGMIATALAFVTLIAGPAMLGAAPRRRTSGEGRGRAFMILFSSLALYYVLPMEVSGPIHHWYTYPRYATFILLSLLLLPRPRLEGRYAWALGPGIASALLMDYAVAKQLGEFAVSSAPFLEIIAAVKPKAMVLPLIDEEKDPACKLNPYNQFHSYIVATRLGYDPYLFDTADIPLVFRNENRPPAPRGGRAASFSMAAHGRFYDYVLVQGLASDPFTKNPAEAAQVTLVREAGKWRLYAVNK